MASSENSKVQGLGNVHRKEAQKTTLKIETKSDSDTKYKEQG